MQGDEIQIDVWRTSDGTSKTISLDKRENWPITIVETKTGAEPKASCPCFLTFAFNPFCEFHSWSLVLWFLFKSDRWKGCWTSLTLFCSTATARVPIRHQIPTPACRSERQSGICPRGKCRWRKCGGSGGGVIFLKTKCCFRRVFVQGERRGRGADHWGCGCG